MCLATLLSLAPSAPAAAQSEQTPPPQKPAPPLIPGPKPKVQPDDKRRTLRSYGHNLAYNFPAVVQHENHQALLIAAAATAAAFPFDDHFEQYFLDHPNDDFADIGAALGSTAAITGLAIGLFSAGRFSRGDRFRAATYDLSQAVIVTQVYTTAVKLVVRRERPDGSNEKSFPSGHASNAFCVASVFASHYTKLAIPAYAFGAYVAVSRMAAHKHFFSDVVAGSGLGWTIGRSVVRRNGRPPDAKPADEAAPEKASFTLAPWAGPSGDGRGVLLLVTF
jgi:membrane-associated phospholipid phosphatase